MTIQLKRHTEDSGAIATGHGDPGGTTLDINGRLAMMAARLDATAYVLLRSEPTGGRVCGRLVAVQGGCAIDDVFAGDDIGHLAAALAAKAECSCLPLLWNAGRKNDADLRYVCQAFALPKEATEALKTRDLLAFPVKLGGFGNVMAIFVGDRLNIDGELVMALHSEAYALAKALLNQDMLRTAPRQNLNERELECLQLAGEGLKSEFIADRLALSVHTVNAYLGTATAKLDSVNRIQAIAKAIRLGYLA